MHRGALVSPYQVLPGRHIGGRWPRYSGPRSIRPSFRFEPPHAWPVRPTPWIEQAHYWHDQTAVFNFVPSAVPADFVGGIADNLKAGMSSFTPLFCSRPDGGAVAPWLAQTLVPRRSTKCYAKGGILFANSAFTPATIPATRMRLEIWAFSSPRQPHYAQPKLELTATETDEAGYGIGTHLESMPWVWFARLLFLDWANPVGIGNYVDWWVG